MSKTAWITIGIPASGKSTWAREWVAKTPNTVEVNLDACRKLVSGDESNQACTPRAVVEHKKQVDQAIEAGMNLVISDTNLNPTFRLELIKKLINAGYTPVYQIFDVPLETCLERNNNRDRQVPLKAMNSLQEAMNSFLLEYNTARNS